MTTVLRRGGDWTALIEAAQHAAGDDETWARGVADAASGLFLTSGRPGLRVLEHSPTCDSARYLTVAMTDTFGHDEGDGGLDALGVADFRTLYYPPGCVTTFRERERSFSGDAAGVAETMRASIGVSDAVGLFAYPEPGLVVFLAAMHDREVSLSRHDRRLLARIGLHLETSFRLRRRPEAIKAVLDLDGRVLERTDDAPSRDVLTAYAAGMNRARSEREGEEALAIWPALVAGRFSLVERRDGAKRRYLLVENAASSQPFRALSHAEAEVVSQAARGHTSKIIAYGLGLAPSIVSGHLTRAAAKIGASSRMDLVRIAAMLTRDPRARFADIALTDAERDVLHLLQQGLSNERIAAIRSRSVRTIANQVASLLRKTNSASRRQLLVMPRRDLRDDAPSARDDRSAGRRASRDQARSVAESTESCERSST
jgi:DNA-binding CsgD family transcriptional regulator